MNLEYSLFFYFLKQFIYNWDYLFLEILVEFTYKTIWALSFLCGKFSTIASISFIVLGLLRIFFPSFGRNVSISTKTSNLLV